MSLPIAEAEGASDDDQALPTLPKGQFLLTSENARPGLIVMAYVVDEQDDWAVEEQPIPSYVAPHDPDPFSEIGTYNDDFDDDDDEESDDERSASSESDASMEDDQSDSDEQRDAIGADDSEDAQSSTTQKSVFLRPFVITRVFDEHYQSMRLATHSSAGIQQLQADAKWNAEHVPILTDDISKAEMTALATGFNKREAVKVRKMYGGAKLEQPCAGWLCWNVSRFFDTDGAVVVGDLETQGFNYLVRTFIEKMMPREMTEEEYNVGLKRFEEMYGKENIRKSTS